MKRVLLTIVWALMIPLHVVVAIFVFIVSVGLGVPKVVCESFVDAIDAFCEGPSFRSMLILIWKLKEKE